MAIVKTYLLKELMTVRGGRRWTGNVTFAVKRDFRYRHMLPDIIASLSNAQKVHKGLYNSIMSAFHA